MTTFCYPYTRGAGWRSQEFRSNPGGFNPPGGHTGFDQAMPVGTPIYAPGDGIIRLSSWVTDNYLANDWWLTRYGGDMLVLDCVDAFGRSETMPTFIFAHLSNSIAGVGQRVKKGQLIGLSGNSGTATTGPHCHIEALPPNWDWNNGVYGRVNAESYFTEWPEDFAVKPTPAAGPKSAPQHEESEVPAYTRITTPAAHRRLAKGKTWTLVDATNKANQNFATLGLGHYDADLFLQGTDLPLGETITVQFFIIPTGGKPSGYFKEEIHGSADGTWQGRARFKMPILKTARLEAQITSSKESAYIDGYSAEVYNWKAGK
ncbi:lysin A, protease M23 domain [Arthrobacter phage Abba]|uniref:Lysin A, protease M23 domain n=1 Tax=Arthrobacter phage Abba TaxID=2713256 RepID=A0A6G8R2C8_9CAUD|nr:metallo-endopeptidase [Arthrobacter phage Abba]QIN94357.1 lysin A, protease M23 domain [Arthrobacter phage Abba]